MALNRHNDSDNQAVGEGNTVSCVVERKKPTRPMGSMIPMREGLYRTRELQGGGINFPSIRSLTFIYNALDALKLVYISVPQLLTVMQLSPVVMRRCTLSTVVNELCARGLLVKSRRKALRGSQLVVVYGMTAQGKTLLALYFAYLAGEYDHLLPR